MKKYLLVALMAVSAFASADQTFRASMNCEGRQVDYSISDSSGVKINVAGKPYDIGMATQQAPNPQGGGLLTLQMARNASNETAALAYTSDSIQFGTLWLMTGLSGTKAECHVTRTWSE